LKRSGVCGIVGSGNLIADYKELKRMNELQAKQIAEALSGETWQSGGGIWLVLLRQGNSKLVVISDEIITDE
jgi:hypothetical protein